MTLGLQARRAYQQLHQCIMAGLLPPGTKLRPQAELAGALGVSLLTVRQALAHLEQDGLISSKHGRGTFVCAPVPPTVLIIEDDPVQGAVLAAHVVAQGGRVIAANGPAQGLVALEQTPSIALVLSDLRVPSAGDGIAFIHSVHRRWPGVPLVAVTAYPEDLRPLQGCRAHPVLILTKPVAAVHVAQILRYAFGPWPQHQGVEPARVAQSTRH